MNWAQRLKRVFQIDIESCCECGGNLRVIACVEKPWLIRKILGHIQAKKAGVSLGARAPPVLTLDAPDLI